MVVEYNYTVYKIIIIHNSVEIYKHIYFMIDIVIARICIAVNYVLIKMLHIYTVYVLHLIILEKP